MQGKSCLHLQIERRDRMRRDKKLFALAELLPRSMYKKLGDVASRLRNYRKECVREFDSSIFLF